MKRGFLALLMAAFCLAALPACGGAGGAAAPQDKPSVITLVPAPLWLLESSRSTDASALSAWHGEPAIEKEYGVSTYTERTYRFEEHTARVLLEQAADPSSAYGLLTYYRSDGMAPVEGMVESVIGGGQALMARGPVFLRLAVDHSETLSRLDWRNLLLAAGGSSPSAHALEQLPEALPARGMVKGSEKYILGPRAAARVLSGFPANLFGFEQGAEVRAAQYTTGHGATLTLAVIDYPTPQIARSAYQPIRDAAGKSGAFDCRRQDAYVLVVLNATSRDAARTFLGGFKVAKQYSEDQASVGPSDVWQLVQLLIANGVLIIMLSAVSLAGGVAVCVGKRLARRWFANSVFVEGEGGGIIVLNLK